MPDFPYPATPGQVVSIAHSHGTPVWIYHRGTIEERIAELAQFDVIRFAQKSNSNLGLLALMRKLGVRLDAVSAGEIHRALKAGFTAGGEHPGIVYTADIFDRDAIALVRQYGIPVNAGSPDMIVQLADAGVRVPLTLRVNPGFGHGHSRKTNTGGDLSKHGIWHEQVGDCVRMAEQRGLSVTGLHMHIGSGSDFEHLAQVCDAMVAVAKQVGTSITTISAGGGLPIPYHKENPERMDIAAYFQLWDRARHSIESFVGHPVALEVEPGRYLVAESGCLVTEVRAIKRMGENLFYLVDAGFTDLIRPAFYGSYHHISVIPSDGRHLDGPVDASVAGPLCESGDVFTQEEGGYVVKRSLPVARVGDYLVLHDTGAYGSAMSSNYNSRLLAAEILLDGDQVRILRKRQSFEHLLANDCIPEFPD